MGIILHSPHDQVTIPDPSRAQIQYECEKFFWQHFPVPGRDYSERGRAQLKLLLKGCGHDYLLDKVEQFEKNNRLLDIKKWEAFWEEPYRFIQVAVTHGGGLFTLDSFYLMLNTIHRLGDEEYKLAARICGQCELYGWVAAKNREWFASKIEKALETSVLFKPNQGWEDMIQFLINDPNHPAVFSYDKTGSFPNYWVANWEPVNSPVEEDERYEQWHQLEESEQWRLAFEGIRCQPGLELKPDDWDKFYFGNGLTAPQLFQAIEWATTLNTGGGLSTLDRYNWMCHFFREYNLALADSISFNHLNPNPPIHYQVAWDELCRWIEAEKLKKI